MEVNILNHFYILVEFSDFLIMGSFKAYNIKVLKLYKRTEFIYIKIIYRIFILHYNLFLLLVIYNYNLPIKFNMDEENKDNNLKVYSKAGTLLERQF